MAEHYPFQLMPLPYAYNALEPYINEETLRLHHSGALKNYVDRLNAALGSYPMYHSWSLDRLISNNGALPGEIRQQVRAYAGGVLNHQNYFLSMSNDKSDVPIGKLAEVIQKQFGSYETFQQVWAENALQVFGSGWTFLVMDLRHESFGSFNILNLINQDIPVSSTWQTILLIDIWEHAFFKQYNFDRKSYVEAWFHLINWERAEQQYLIALEKKPPQA